MRFFFYENRSIGAIQLSRFFRSKSLRNKLLLTLLPTVVAMLVITGAATYFISHRYLTIALHRTVRVQTLAQASAIEEFLDQCREDLLLFAQGPATPEAMRNYLARLIAAKGTPYCEFVFVSQKDKAHVCVVQGGDGLRILSREECDEIRPHPVLLYDQIKNFKGFEVWISKIVQVELPYPTPENLNNKIVRQVIRFATPCLAEDKTSLGYFVLSVDAVAVRNILSRYNSTKSPIYAFSRVSELRFSYLFDTEGWILFQSDSIDNASAELATTLASSGYTGTLGKTGLPNAFLPGPTWNSYWKMVADVAEGKQDLVRVEDEETRQLIAKDHALAYAPIRFSQSGPQPSFVYAGLAFLDTSRLTLVAGYKHMDVIFLVLLVSALATSLLVFVLSRFITQPIADLTEAVRQVQQTGRLEEIELEFSGGYETTALHEAINSMISAMRRQMSEIRAKEREIETVYLKERVSLEDTIPAWPEEEKPDPIPEIVGLGPIIEKWKSDILKAAQTVVDVLIFGETGTGKQLAAEAVHNCSKRADNPFVSINCGALDENLLLDTLFGHTRGAFTEARNERKGAFLEAHGGTLFLDEIQAASLKVQQALLRAIAMRKVKPLGSDKEIDVDVRLLVATNLDLSQLIDQKLFREDLYFRLKVVTIHTPPLRLHKENIARLAGHFLNEAMLLAHKQDLALSKGALEKLRAYSWPGNVRELKNAITRVVVMTENKVIQAEELFLEADAASLPQDESRAMPAVQEQGKPAQAKPASATASSATPPAQPQDLLARLNERQKKAFAHIRQKGEINRSDYQRIVGGELPSRTAIYDLQDLVKKGVLLKNGKGPATKYLLIETE